MRFVFIFLTLLINKKILSLEKKNDLLDLANKKIENYKTRFTTTITTTTTTTTTIQLLLLLSNYYCYYYNHFSYYCYDYYYY